MQHNSDFRYDLKRGQEAEEWFAGLLTSDSIECKRDYRAHNTGNVFVEFESRGKPSGIRRTEAEHWAFIYGPSELDLRVVVISAERLKTLAEAAIAEDRWKPGGDSNTSKGAIIPLEDLVTDD
jgi:hypothetical protein